MRLRPSVLLIAVLTTLLGLGFLPRGAFAAPGLDEHLRSKAPSIVEVKCVLKIHISFGAQALDRERKVEIAGAVVDPSGLVMLTNLGLGGDSGGIQKALLAKRFPGAEMTAVPTDLKVLVGDDAVEHDAVLVARDSQLGLAYVQVLGLESKTLASIDLSKGGTPRVGQELFGVSRLDRSFDYAPEIRTLYANRRVEQPRLLWGIAGDFQGIGLPVFDTGGTPVGVLSIQGGTDDGGDRGGFLLPLDAVAKSLDSARKRVPEALATAAEEKEKAAKEAKEAKESPKDPPKDAPKDAPPADGPAMGAPPVAPK